MGQLRVIPTGFVTCRDQKCSRRGIQIFDAGGVDCLECGGDLYDVEEAAMDDEVRLEEGVDLRGTPQESGVRHGVGLKKPASANGSVKDMFRCPSDLTGCPVAVLAKVNIPIDMYNKWLWLAGQLSTEWIAYLQGEETGPFEFTITDMYFPKQKANPGHVEAADGEIRPGTVATVHSHVGMKAFFSTEDCAHFNHPIEMVINRAGDLVANGRVKLECGRYHRGPAEVYFLGCEGEEEVEAQLREVLEEDKAVFMAKGGIGSLSGAVLKGSLC